MSKRAPTYWALDVLARLRQRAAGGKVNHLAPTQSAIEPSSRSGWLPALTQLVELAFVTYLTAVRFRSSDIRRTLNFAAR